MELRRATAFILMVGLSAAGRAQQATPSAATVGEPTPAQQSIVEARLQIKNDPKQVQAYNQLALAFLRRVRETSNPEYLQDAGTAIAQGLELDPDDFQLQKTQVALMLGRHEFVKARERAIALHHRTPDDVMTYGYIAEADIALGDYREAEKNAQWMLNLRPNNIPGLLLGAELRALFGDPRGALDFLHLAYSESSPIEVEEQAYIENQIASIQLDSGQIDAAAQTLELAETTFPHYLLTMENLARVRIAQHRPEEASELLVRASLIDSDPAIVYQLARAREAAGQSAEARASYTEFEKLANKPGRATQVSRLDLIFMYAGNSATASAALKLAQQAIEAQHDVWTLDAYGWALYANADFQGADAAVQKALAVGIQSAQILDHAGHIAEKLNHGADAAKYFKLATLANPMSEYAADSIKSAKPAMVADDHGQQASALARAPASPSAVSSSKPVESSGPSNTSAHLPSVGRTIPAPVFAPVPEALLRPSPTATDRLIRSAQGNVARTPTDAKAYARLGSAYFQRARETGDVSDYQFAEQALRKSLALVSTDFSANDALGAMAEVCMGEHRFADALTYSQKALSLGAGDISSFAVAGDAYADMGEYDKAGAAYGQLTPPDSALRPRAAYARDSRLSYLRFIAGDTDGAIALMNSAVKEGIEAQLPSENLAWLYYELGEYSTQAGDAASADAAYLEALNVHPGDYRALAALARLRANNARYAEAITLYQKAIAVVPMPVFVAELGDLYAKVGNQPEAQKQYALVEYMGLLGHINQVLHNRDLALFYADHDTKLVEALDLARRELDVRHDVYTWDALAWALYKNDRLAEAAKASENARQYGTRDSLLLFHAGLIDEKLGERERARDELEEALQINPHFHLTYASVARQTVAALEAKPESKEGSE